MRFEDDRRTIVLLVALTKLTKQLVRAVIGTEVDRSEKTCEEEPYE